MNKLGMLFFWVLLLNSFSINAAILSEEDIKGEIPLNKQHLIDDVIRLNQNLSDKAVKFCDLTNLSEVSCLRKITTEQYAFDFTNNKFFKVVYGGNPPLPSSLQEPTDVEQVFGNIFIKKLEQWKEKHKDNINLANSLERLYSRRL